MTANTNTIPSTIPGSANYHAELALRNRRDLHERLSNDFRELFTLCKSNSSPELNEALLHLARAVNKLGELC